MKRLVGLLVMSAVLLCNLKTSMGDEVMIEKGKKVKFDYTLTVKGEVVDTSIGKQPLEYVHGQGTIIKGLEKELEGMKVGDERTIQVAAEDAYGPVSPEAIQEVPRTLIPPDVEVQVGMMVPLQDKEGRSFPAVVQEIKDTVLVLNFNHPLAGEELTFEVKVLEISD